MLARIGVKFFQIVGVPSDLEWSQLQVVNSSSMDEMSKGGGLSVLMSVEGDQASERGNEWLQAVVEGFLKNIEKDRVEWLKDTVRWFEGICGDSDSLLLLVVLPHEGVTKKALYLAGKGGIRVYVSRDGAQKIIWSGEKGTSVVSGWLNDDDVVVAGTDHFVDEVWANLEGEVVEMVEEARDSIGAHEKRGRMAGMVMIMGKGDGDEDFEVLSESKEVNDIKKEMITPLQAEDTVQDSVTIEVSTTEAESVETKDDMVDTDDTVDPILEKNEMTMGTPKDGDNFEDVVDDDAGIDENFKMVEQIVDDIPEQSGEFVDSMVSVSETELPRDGGLEDRVLGGASVGQLGPGNEKRERTRRFVVILGVLFLLVFGVALTFGVIKSRRDGEEKRFAEFVTPIDYNLSEASKLKTVNQVRSRALVEEARIKFGEGKVYEKGRFEEKYGDLSKRIDDTWKEISGERGADGKLFADLGVIRDGFDIHRVVFDENWGFVAIDRGKGSVAMIDKSGTMRVVAGGDKYKSLRSMTLSKKGGYFLTDDGVYVVDFKTQAEQKLIEKDDEIWGGVSEIGLFGSSVYLLDRIDIWKYPGLDDGVGKRQRWFKPGVEPDLSKAVDMKIATDIFVLTEGEDVFKFASGTKDSFALRQVNDHGTASRMAVSEKKKELYVLEKDKKRVVVYDMVNGEYKKQLIWESLAQAKDLVMSDSLDKLFVTVGGKMFEVVFQ